MSPYVQTIEILSEFSGSAKNILNMYLCGEREKGKEKKEKENHIW